MKHARETERTVTYKAFFDREEIEQLLIKAAFPRSESRRKVAVCHLTEEDAVVTAQVTEVVAKVPDTEDAAED